MSTADLKVEIFRKIDGLDEIYLQKIYKYISEIMDKRIHSKEWDTLSSAQKSGLINAIKESEKGIVLSDDHVISKYKKRYQDAR